MFLSNMKAKYIRTSKTQKLGASLMISIPKEFCEKEDIKVGTPMDIFDGSVSGYKMIIIKKHETDLKGE